MLSLIFCDQSDPLLNLVIDLPKPPTAEPMPNAASPSPIPVIANKNLALSPTKLDPFSPPTVSSIDIKVTTESLILWAQPSALINSAALPAADPTLKTAKPRPKPVIATKNEAPLPTNAA